MDQDQYSNATRPSTTIHRSQDHQQQQTNTSQHNPLLSERRISEPNQTQNEVQAISTHQPQSQQLNNQNIGIEQRQVNSNQVPVIRSNAFKEQIVPNQQNQRQAKQYHHSVEIVQSHSNQQLEHRNEDDSLYNNYREEDNGTENLNTKNMQNYNQNNQVYREIDVVIKNVQAQTDLLDFRRSLEEQMQSQKLKKAQQQNKESDIVQKEPQRFQNIKNNEPIRLEIQYDYKKDIPMDIESESKGYLTEKESHKSDKFYHQRQIQWEKHQQHSHASSKSDIQQVHLYEQKIPQNNSNLFRFGFTITSKKKNKSDIKTPSPKIHKLQLSKTEKSEQDKREIELVMKIEVQHYNIQKDKNEQQSIHNYHDDRIFKDSSFKSQKPQKNSQIKSIQQQKIEFENNNHSSNKSNKQKQQKKEELVEYNEIKDELPSQVPVDQFQNNSKNQPFAQIQFQSISAISFNEKQNQSKPYEVQTIEEYDNNNSQKENNPINSQQNVIKQLKNIHTNKSQQRDEHNFLQLQHLLETHINLITLKPIDQIGQQILENGQYTMMFIDLFVLNSPIGEDRKLFHKYLVSALSHYVNQNKQVYQKYKQRFWPRKNEKFTITDCYNFKNSPRKREKHQQQHEIQQKYSVEVHDASVHDRSVQQGPRSIMKSNSKRIKEPRTEMPIPRNPGNLQRAEVNHQNQKETKYITGSLQKVKKGKQTKKRVTVKKQKTPEKQEKLGYAETFVTVEDKNGNQVLKTRKVSLRLLQKSNKQKSQSKQIKNQRSRPKKKNHHIEQQYRPNKEQQIRKNSPKASAKKKVTIRKSARLTQNQENQQQILTVDYIKSHFQELKIDSDYLKMLSTGTLLTEEDKQIAKMLEEYKKILQQQERLALDLQMSHQMAPIQEPSQHQIEQDTENPASMQRIRQIKQQLQINKLKKYKIMEQIAQKHIVIENIIDPDINQHGIYALVKVSKMTSVLCGARYFLIPMSKLQLCSRDKIDEDIKTIKSLVEESEKDNIGLLKPSSKIQEAIEAQKNKRSRQSKKK